jgi:hypothetical protein
MTTDLVHATAMAVWGLGLPLLFWHRFERLSHAYTLFSITFVLTSVVSHLTFGECILTTLARELWQAGGSFREAVPFTVTLTNRVAGLRPSTRSAVLLWEGAVLLTSLGSLWSWRKARRRHGATLRASCSRHSRQDLPAGGA